ncbi:50S ribosomal protein-like protein [Thalictrum thalictroides]|uniref:50S ribosomal protein-like protein n=1 Tax=Thalictrum thalictroides TaxID=46969 RepID=A0A7J6WNJ6_THATH|nr:50S ribosomal protein-like protein [Thalictrum thalictroides]
MARSLQKFKFLATQCAVAGSPTRSPTTSPVFQLRRRKTLRMFLSRSGGATNRRLNRNQEEVSLSSSDKKGNRNVEEVDSSSLLEKNSLISKKLKDLFVSSPPLNDETSRNDDYEDSRSRQVLIDRVRRSINRRSGGRNRHLSAAFRYRLLRRPWRPVLFTIPE